MSDAFYAEMADTALEVIDEFRQGVLLLDRRTPVKGPQPWDPDVPTYQSFPVVGTVQAIDRRYVDGTTIVATDRIVIVPANSLPVSVVPQLGDRLTIDGVKNTIKRVIRVPEAGVIIVYRLIVGA